MKKFKKFISVFLAITTVLCMFAVTANALTGYSTTLHVNAESRFNGLDEWEHTRHYISGGKYIGRLVYGYDTDYVDEDYAWAYGADCQAQAAIKRDGEDSNFVSAEVASANHYSKLQVTHEVNDVYYRITFEIDYENVIYYKDTSTFENRS